MNSVNILGNLTRDPEFKQAGETSLVRFGIAVNERYKGEEKAHFFNVVAFGRLAETVDKYLSKGARVAISGRLDYSSWEKDGEKRSAVGIVANQIDFPPKSEAPVKSAPAAAPAADEEIPF